MLEIKGKYTTATVMIDEIEENCYKQILQFVNNVAFTNPIKIMPDCHAGKGSCIGFTMRRTNKLNPEIVGVDIGCGMLSVRLPKDVDLSNLGKIDSNIRRLIPMGTAVNSNNIAFKKYFSFNELSKKLGHVNFTQIDFNFLCDKLGCDVARIEKGVSSAGGGNHFQEIGVDENGDYWLTIHTGSRNFGKQVCDYHVNIAKTVVKEKLSKEYTLKLEHIKKSFPKSSWETEIKKLKTEYGRNDSNNQSNYFLQGKYLTDYLNDMIIAQYYAEVNRKAIAFNILLNVFNLNEEDLHTLELIESVHNYLNFEDGIIRKGAISAYKGEKLIIPWNMRDGLIIGEGKSNPDWNYSAPHGAGRVLSRSAAKRELSIDDFKEQMKGIYSTSICNSTLDEAPDSYKDYQVIKDAIEPTVEILHTVKPILNIKAL